jgi:hypothetical protein
MNELGAGLDGGGPARQPLRVDAAADARSRFEHDDAQAGAHESARCLQSRRAGPDDDDIGVGVAVTSSTHGGKHARCDAQ